MEFLALSGKEIDKLVAGEGSLTFTTELEGIEANIKVEGIVEITKNGEITEVDDTLETILESVDIDVTELEEDTFSEVTIVTEDGDTWELSGEMKGTVLNIEDFAEIIEELKRESDDGWYDEDEDCGCGGDCGEDCECDEV